MKIDIILASASPRRKELLSKIVKKFRVVESGVDESIIKTSSPLQFVKKAAILKAKAVAQKNTKSIVIGADTVVLLGRKILGKPKDVNDAVSMLKSLSGKSQKVITGIAVVFPDKQIISDIEVTRVKMKKVSLKDIIDYVKTAKPLDKAGAYGIQELDEVFIDSIKGDYDNVVGLPVYKLKKILVKFL